MRILHHDPSNPAEHAAYTTLLRRIDKFWQDFQSRTGDLNAAFQPHAESDWIPAWIIPALADIAPNLMWEFGQALHTKGHRLVITPEAHHHLRPLVDLLLQRKPNLPGWEFYPYRLPEEPRHASDVVEAKTGFSLNGATCKAVRGRFNRIDLEFFLTGTAPDKLDHVAFYAAEELLGEELLDTWIGAIEAKPAPSGLRKLFGSKTSALPTDRLHPTVQSLIDAISDQLPSEPCWKRKSAEDHASLLELQPEQADDYVRQEDLWVTVVPDVELFKAVHVDPNFSSRRFSRFNETFCYLKIDRRDGFSDKVDDRGKIEDLIDEILIPKQLGCTHDGGTGLRYSYIQLALTDVKAALQALQQPLQPHLPVGTWLLFHDGHLTHEWLPLHPQTPPPLLPTPSNES